MSNSKQWKLFFFKLSFIALIGFFVMLIVDSLYRHQYSLAYHRPFRITPNAAGEKQFQVVKTGNSHSGEGITFAGYRARTLDLAGAAQPFETDLALLKQHAKEIEKNALIIIPVSPISFSQTSVIMKRGFQVRYYDRISPCLIPHLDWGDYIESEYFPCVRSAYTWREKRAAEVKEKIEAQERGVQPSLETQRPDLEAQPVSFSNAKEKQQTTPAQQVTKQTAKQKTVVLRMPQEEYFFNVSAMNAELASPSATSIFANNSGFIANRWLHTDEFHPRAFNKNRHDLEKLLRYCLDQGWRPVMITIPVATQIMHALPEDYAETYVYENMRKLNVRGVEYIDYLQYEPIATNSSLFRNVDHLYNAGPPIFSYVLLQDLIERGYLSKEVDGYDYGPLYMEVWQ